MEFPRKNSVQFILGGSDPSLPSNWCQRIAVVNSVDRSKTLSVRMRRSGNSKSECAGGGKRSFVAGIPLADIASDTGPRQEGKSCHVNQHPSPFRTRSLCMIFLGFALGDILLLLPGLRQLSGYLNTMRIHLKIKHNATIYARYTAQNSSGFFIGFPRSFHTHFFSEQV
jgi:hypothetical protein